jgi:hypothetical protein
MQRSIGQPPEASVLSPFFATFNTDEIFHGSNVWAGERQANVPRPAAREFQYVLP